MLEGVVSLINLKMLLIWAILRFCLFGKELNISVTAVHVDLSGTNWVYKAIHYLFCS